MGTLKMQEWKNRSGKISSRQQGWNMQEWKMQERQRMESRKKRKVGPIRYQQLEAQHDRLF